MKRNQIPNTILAVALVAFLLVFGGATLVMSGSLIVQTASESAARAEGGYFDAVKVGIKAVETEYNLVLFKKYDFVSLNGAMRNVMGKQLFPDSGGDLSMVKLNDGMLSKLKLSLDVKALREPLTKFRDYLAEMDIPLIFTYVHTKILDPETQLPFGATDNSNAIADEFIALLEDLDIDHIDTRKTLLATGLDTTELYYVTDTHWTIPAAFSVYQELARKLNEQYAFGIDEKIIDEASYEVTTYEERFLGSYGRTVGVQYSGLDDFTTVLPKFSSHIVETTQDNDGVWETREGTFEESVLHPEHLTPDEGETYSSRCYSMYGYNRGEELYENEEGADKRILFIKNSSGNPITDFTALGVQHVCGLDRRTLTRITIADYVAEYKPDVVVIVYNYDFLKADRLDFFSAPLVAELE